MVYLELLFFLKRSYLPLLSITELFHTLPLFPSTRANAMLLSASVSKTPARLWALKNDRSLPTQHFTPTKFSTVLGSTVVYQMLDEYTLH